MRSQIKLSLAKDDINLATHGAWDEGEHSGPGISLSAGATPISTPKTPLNQSSGQLSPGRRRPMSHIHSPQTEPADSIASLKSSPINVGALRRSTRNLQAVSPNERSNVAQSVHQMRCKYVDMIATPPTLIGGTLTLTDSQFIFEPDLDDPQVEKLGLRHYTVFLEMGSIVHAESLKPTDMSVPMKVEEALLQVLTSEKQVISTSNMIIFLGLESKYA